VTKISIFSSCGYGSFVKRVKSNMGLHDLEIISGVVGAKRERGLEFR
jgi:hypothetical protein